MPGDGDPAGDYEKAHIPGAVFMDLSELRDTSSDLPMMLPPAEKFASRMQSLGRSMLLLNRLLPAEETLHKIEAITMEDVLRVAHETLTAEPSAAVVGKKAEQYLKRIGGELHG